MFGFITINNGRPQILHLFCASIKRLRQQLAIDFPVVVTSGAEDAPLCSEYNIGHIIYSNIPVSEKWNQSCLYMKELGVDWVVVTGSDDIFSTEALYNLTQAMQVEPDLIGTKRLFVYDTDGVSRGALLQITSRNFFGVGKTIHRRVLEKVNWRPWDYPAPRNWGHDAICHKNISPHVKSSAEYQGIIVDCKSKESLNKFTMLRGKGIPMHKSIFLDILSKEERQILDSIQHVGLPIKFPNIKKRGRTLI